MNAAATLRALRPYQKKLTEQAEEIQRLLAELNTLQALVRRCECGEATRHDAPLCEECAEERRTQAPNWPALSTEVAF